MCGLMPFLNYVDGSWIYGIQEDHESFGQSLERNRLPHELEKTPFVSHSIYWQKSLLMMPGYQITER